MQFEPVKLTILKYVGQFEGRLAQKRLGGPGGDGLIPNLKKPPLSIQIPEWGPQTLTCIRTLA